jgi:hypothetical protein
MYISLNKEYALLSASNFFSLILCSTIASVIGAKALPIVLLKGICMLDLTEPTSAVGLA